MPATRAEWLELLSSKHNPANNGGDRGPRKYQVDTVRVLIREYLTDNFVLDISTVELVDALFPGRWVLVDKEAEAAQNRLFAILKSRGVRKKLVDCYRSGETPNRWGGKPYLWSTPAEPLPKPAPARRVLKCCPTCGKVL